MISVVVPVYNVEKYLDKCVQSILAQTYEDFELILVDDGSLDKCPLLCDEYARKYKKIRVLHKKNGGLSDARNAGTAIASGNYITYIDSDDFISKDYLENLFYMLKKNNADISVTGIESFFEGEDIKTKSESKTYIYSGREALKKMLYQDTLDTSACAMLLPIDIAKKYPFPVGKYHEDEFTTYKFYSSAERVAVSTKKQYFYLQRTGSIMHVFGKSSMDELDAADNLVEFCKDNYPDIVPAAESKKFSDYCQVLLSNTDFEKKYSETFIRIKEYLISKRKQILFDKNCRKKNRVAALLLLGGVPVLRKANWIKNRKVYTA